MILVKELLLEPKDMGRRIQEMVDERLKEAVEGKLVGNIGFVVCVLNISDSWRGSGVLDNSQGAAVFKVSYEALVFRPFVGETIDAIVKHVNAFGFSCTVGNMFDIFISRRQMPPDIKTMEADAWVSDDGQQIKANYGVRLRIISIRFESLLISGVGTIADHYCGLLFTE